MDLQHQIMLRLLFYTAVRVSELAGIRVEDVDLAAGKVVIERGKGDKDRYILFHETFRLAPKAFSTTGRGLVDFNRHSAANTETAKNDRQMHLRGSRREQ